VGGEMSTLIEGWDLGWVGQGRLGCSVGARGEFWERGYDTMVELGEREKGRRGGC